MKKNIFKIVNFNKKNKIKKYSFPILLALLVTPSFSLAVGNNCVALGSDTTIEYLICRLSVLLNSIIPVLIALGVVYLIYGVVVYVIAKDEDAKGRGKNQMIYGLIGLFAIVTVWGLILMMVNTFGLAEDAPPETPTNDNLPNDPTGGPRTPITPGNTPPPPLNLGGYDTI